MSSAWLSLALTIVNCICYFELILSKLTKLSAALKLIWSIQKQPDYFTLGTRYRYSFLKDFPNLPKSTRVHSAIDGCSHMRPVWHISYGKIVKCGEPGVTQIVQSIITVFCFEKNNYWLYINVRTVRRWRKCMNLTIWSPWISFESQIC